MSLLNYFLGRQKPSAIVAKERLQVILAHERPGRGSTMPDYLPALKEELLSVIAKYVIVNPDQIKVIRETHDNCEILELNIVLPEAQRNTKRL